MVRESRGGVSLDDLAVFRAVAEQGGFSAAARQLGLSKAAVSVAVTRLEAGLGVRLFQRTTRRLSLTDAGRAALPPARDALAAAQDAVDAAVSQRTRPVGTLRITAPMSFGILHVAPALAEFAARYPELDVALDLDDRFVDLVQGAYDLALRIGAMADSSLVATTISRSSNVLVASPGYLERRGAPRNPGELPRHDAVGYALAADALDWRLRRGRRTARIAVRPRVTTNSSLALKAIVANGYGIARVPYFAVIDELRDGRLVRVLPEWTLPELPIRLVTTSRRQLPLKTKLLQDHLRRALAAGFTVPRSSPSP